MKQLLLHLFLICSMAFSFAMAQDGGDPFYDVQPGNSLHSFSQYFKSNTQENINPSSGGLTLVATDVSLPGRNGLDLNIHRVYRSNYLIAPAKCGNPYYMDLGYVPQWSSMGMGWKCFIALVTFRTSSPGYPATLFMGDGGIYEFTSDNGVDYYTKGPEKYRIRKTGNQPVLYFPDGKKYRFGVRTTLVTWGFNEESYCATQIEDANGNCIRIHYRGQNHGNNTCPGTEPDTIFDTNNRIISLIWCNDPILYIGQGNYPIGHSPKLLLQAIQIDPHLGEPKRTLYYLYDTLSMGRAEQRNNNGVSTWQYQGQVSVLSAVFINSDQCMVRYQYGRTNGNYSYTHPSLELYNPNNPTNPNPDRGQLIRVLYPSGAMDKYRYKLVCEETPSTNIYSVVSYKGDAEHDSVWRFEYSSPNAAWPMSYGFFTQCKVTNIIDNIRTIYRYSTNSDFFFPYHGKYIPLIEYQVDTSLVDGNYRSVHNVWKTVTLNQKKAALLDWTETVVNSVPQYRKEISNPANPDLNNYDDPDIVRESGTGCGTAYRKTFSTFLHRDPQLHQKYCNDTTWVLGLVTERRVYEDANATRLVSLDRYRYDVLPCSTYLDTAFGVPDRDMARGNCNYSTKYAVTTGGTLLDSLVTVNKYDYIGNMIQTVNGQNDTTIYLYHIGHFNTVFNGRWWDRIYGEPAGWMVGSAKPGTAQDKLAGVTGNAGPGVVDIQAANTGSNENKINTIIGGQPYDGFPVDGSRLMGVRNKVYGLSKNYNYYGYGMLSDEWSAEGGATGYRYEKTYFRPIAVWKQGDELGTPSVTYQYQDCDPNWSAWNMSVGWLNGGQEPPANPEIYVKETQRKNEYETLSPVTKYYNRNGYLKQKEQGGVKVDYEFNTLGLLTRQTNPYTGSPTGVPATTYQYDYLKRVKLVTLPDGHTLKYSYGVNNAGGGSYRTFTDAKGNITRHEYDGLGRLLRVIDAKGKITSYEYDALDHLTKITTPGGNEHRYRYNSYGQLTGKRDPDSDSSAFWYDKAGNMTKYQDAKLIADSKYLTYTYDHIGRPLTTNLFNGSTTTNLITNTYDNYSFVPPSDTGAVAAESVAVSNTIPYIPPQNCTNLDPAATSTVTGRTLHVDYQPSEAYPVSDWRHASDWCGQTLQWPSMCYNTNILEVITHNNSNPPQMAVIGLGLCGAFSRNGVDRPTSPYTTSLCFGYENPNGGQVNSAILYLYRTTRNTSNTLSVNMRLAVGDASNPPELGYSSYAYSALSSPEYSSTTTLIPMTEGWKQFDMTQQCQYMFTNPNYVPWNAMCLPTVRLEVPSNSPNATWANYFYSGADSNGFYRPRIVMDWQSGDLDAPQLDSLTTQPLPAGIKLHWGFSNDWTVDTLQYGLTTAYGTTVTFPDTAPQRDITINDLAPLAVHHFRIISRDITGNRSVSQDYTFTTDSLSFVNYSVCEVDHYGARIKWTLNYLNPVTVYYGADQSLPDSSVVSGSSVYLSTLEPGKRYYFKIVTRYGGRMLATPVQTFRTPGIGCYRAGKGRLTRVQDGSGETVLAYDDLGRTLLRRYKPADLARTYDVSTFYNQAGSPIIATNPDGSKQYYDYDGFGRLQRIRNQNLDTLVTYTYNVAGLDSVGVFGNGVKSTNSYYNARFWLQRTKIDKIGGSNYFNHAYSYDLNGNLEMEEVYTEGYPYTEYNYQYDQLNRLTDETGVSYVYDDMGNRTQCGSTTYQYFSGRNRLKSVDYGAQYQYLANGSMTYDGANTHTYDYLTRLTSTNNGKGTTLDYTYNSSGLRTKLVTTTGEAVERGIRPGTRPGGRVEYASAFGQVAIQQEANQVAFTLTLNPDVLAGRSTAYVTVDADQKMGSGAEWLPDGTTLRVPAERSWEYCLYADGKTYGYITPQGERVTQGTVAADGARTKVKARTVTIRMPRELFGKSNKLYLCTAQNSTVKTFKAAQAVGEGLVGGGILYPLVVLPNSTTERYLYDLAGNTICDLDANGEITKKYLYAGSRNLATQTKGSSYGPYINTCEDSTGFTRGGDSAPITLAIVTDCKQGNKAVRVTTGTGNYGNFAFYNQNTQYSTASYRYLHLWVKPLTAGSWLTLHVYDVTNGSWKTMSSDRDGNMYYTVGEDLAVNQWNEVWIDLNVNDRHWKNTTVRAFSLHSSPNSQFIFDHLYCASGQWNTYYSHCDYLGSPRVMTNAAGQVSWKQDYYAFGGERTPVATGNTHKFTGHIKDDATGQYYAKARYFTTQLGRWSQPEPLLKGVPVGKFLYNPQMLNPYVYCANNPTKYIDPTGLIVKVSAAMQPFVDEAKKSRAFRIMYERLHERQDIILRVRSQEKLEDRKHNTINGLTAFEKIGDIRNIFADIRTGRTAIEERQNITNRIINALGHEFRHAIEQGIITEFDLMEEMEVLYYLDKSCTPEAAATGNTVEAEATKGSSETEEPVPSKTTTNGNPWYWLTR